MSTLNGDYAIDCIIYVLETGSEYLKTRNKACEVLTPMFKERNIIIKETFCEDIVYLYNKYKKIVIIYNENSLAIKQFLKATKNNILQFQEVSFDGFPEWNTFHSFYTSFGKTLKRLITVHELWFPIELSIQTSKILRDELKLKQENTFPYNNTLLRLRFNSLKPEEKKVVLEAVNYFNLTKDSFNKENISKLYKTEAIRHHPDKGGDPESFKTVVKYKDFLYKLLD